MREIGSEFHKIPMENAKGISLPEMADHVFVFSGRTAIETVLKSVANHHKVLLPSYCCDSMIEPFRKAGDEIGFYDVNYYDGLKIDFTTSDDVDIVVICNYFGFKTPMPDLIEFKKHGIVIEDITHSLLSDMSYHDVADYCVASLRKWFPLNCGGYCVSRNNLLVKPYTEPKKVFLNLRRNAMMLKTNYLTNKDECKKQKFLNMYNISNDMISDIYSGTIIDNESLCFISHVDVEKVRTQRRNNAHTLYETLNGKVNFMFPECDMDCPLFVPIILPGRREKIRNFLIKNKIYCPAHWPQPITNCKSNLYGIELSLICDQRYTESDMKRLASLLCEVL